MSANRMFPRRLNRAMQRLASSGNENLYSLLTSANPYYQSFYDDFIGAAVRSEWAAVGGTGTPARAIHSAANVSQMTLTTTTTSGDTCIQGVATQWPSDGVYFYAVAQLDTITSAKIEVGLGDSTTTAGMVNVKATPTASGTNFGVFCFDTTDNTDLDFITCNAGTVTNEGTSGVALAAATNLTFEVWMENGAVAGYVNGQLVGSGTIATSAALTPYLFVKTNTSAARKLSVDAVGCFSINHLP